MPWSPFTKLQMRTESGPKGAQQDAAKPFRMMVARDVVELPTPAFSDNLSDSRWPPKSLRSRERHANRGLESWVQSVLARATTARGEVHCQFQEPINRGLCRDSEQLHRN